MMNFPDKICFFLLIIIISSIIGLNIVNIIDKKISNVEINIPKIKIPEPKIKLTINKKMVDKIKENFENTNSNLEKDKCLTNLTNYLTNKDYKILRQVYGIENDEELDFHLNYLKSLRVKCIDKDKIKHKRKQKWVNEEHQNIF